MTKRPRDEDEGSCPWMNIRNCTPFRLFKRTRFHGIGDLETSHGLTWIRRHKLGQGAFASVYSASSRSNAPAFFLDGNGAISIMPSQLAVKSAEISKSSSLQSELEILSNLNSSSYVVRCYGNEITMSADGKFYYNILMENCCGGSLGRLIRNSGGGVGLPENEVRSITRDIVRGLCYIHSRGYVHCDIKADNILLVPSDCCNSSSFRAKIGDLGLAKEAYCHPADEDLRGTLRYMSPELLIYNMQSWLSDIWALGCVVIEMMSGKLVWSCDQSEVSDMKDILRRIVYSSDLPKFPCNISEQGKSFLESCLHRNVDERWSALKLLNHPFLSEGDQRL